LQKERAMKFARYVILGIQFSVFCSLQCLFGGVSTAQMIDNTQATSTANAGINTSLSDEIGAGRGRCADAKLVDLHHQSRSLPLDSPRTTVIPEEVHAGAGSGTE
jgi:hypothetical protein